MESEYSDAINGPYAPHGLILPAGGSIDQHPCKNQPCYRPSHMPLLNQGNHQQISTLPQHADPRRPGNVPLLVFTSQDLTSRMWLLLHHHSMSLTGHLYCLHSVSLDRSSCCYLTGCSFDRRQFLRLDSYSYRILEEYAYPFQPPPVCELPPFCHPVLLLLD